MSRLSADVWVHDEERGDVLLPAGTTVPDWAERHVTNSKAFATAEVEARAETEDDGGPTKAELVAELKRLELPTSGNKQELVERLEQARAETEE